MTRFLSSQHEPDPPLGTTRSINAFAVRYTLIDTKESSFHSCLREIFVVTHVSTRSPGEYRFTKQASINAELN